MIRPDRKTVAEWEASLPDPSRRNLRHAADRIVGAKRRGGSVVVVTGSGPNIHERIVDTHYFCLYYGCPHSHPVLLSGTIVGQSWREIVEGAIVDTH